MARPSPIPFPSAIEWASRTPFVARTAERQLLASRFEAAAGGERRVVLVGGEPGVGKTRLLSELARDAYGRGAIVLFGRCDEEPQIPYQPFLEAFRHLVVHAPIDLLRAHTEIAGDTIARLAPDLLDRVTLAHDPLGDEVGEAARGRLFSAAASLLSATSATAPVVLVLDDLHWAGTPTLLLLRHLVRALAGRPVLIAGTYRDTELGRTHPFADTLADLRREPDIDRVSLDGLDVEGVSALVDALHATGAPDELARELHRETDGNPFFVVEMVRHLDESSDTRALPAGAREVIGRRLSRLSSDANRLLATAAIIGPEFDVEVLAAVDGKGEDAVLDAIDEATRAKLVDEAPASHAHYRFAHALVRQTLLDELSSTRRVLLHRRVGEAIERRFDPALEGHLATLAYHFGEAAPGGDLDRAASYAARAARQAIDQVAYESALELTARGLATIEEASDHPDQARRSELLLVASMAHERMGVDERLASDAARDAALAARAAGSAHHLADAVWAYCRFARIGWNGQDAIEFAEEALRLLPLDARIDRSRVMAVLAITRGFIGERAEAIRLADDALALARGTDDVDTLANALIAVAVSRWGTAEVESMRDSAAEMARLPIGPERPYFYLFGLRMQATVQLLEADMAGFDATVDEAEVVARRVSYGFFVIQAITWRAMRALLRGRWDEAIASVSELAPMMSDPNGFMVFAALSFILELERGHAAGVVPLLEAALENDPGIASFRAGAAFAQLEMGDPVAARAHLDIVLADGLDGVIDNWMTAMQLAWLSQVAHGLGDADLAAQLEPRVAPYAGRLVVIGSGMHVLGAFDRYRALLASTLGRHDDAVERAHAALSLETEIDAPPHIARSRLALAQVLVARGAAGDADEARAQLEACQAGAEALGMALLAEQAGTLRTSF